MRPSALNSRDNDLIDDIQKYWHELSVIFCVGDLNIGLPQQLKSWATYGFAIVIIHLSFFKMIQSFIQRFLFFDRANANFKIFLGLIVVLMETKRCDDILDRLHLWKFIYDKGIVSMCQWIKVHIVYCGKVPAIPHKTILYVVKDRIPIYHTQILVCLEQI